MATNWQIGDRIQNRWEVRKILTGGMGVVYVVYDHEHGDVYAAKTFQDEVFARAPNIADRFTQEALTWVKLDSHQNVTKALFVQRIEGKPILFLEYVSGGDLSGWINTSRLTEDLPQVLRFAIQFCDGMRHALAKGVTAHRDIKPANCLITQDNILKVTDFGLAKAFNDAGEVCLEEAPAQSLRVGLTRTGVAGGTCTHMAPEQFDDAKHVGVRSDIYSFGVMLYQMAMGRLPFVGRTWQEYERLHKSQPVPTLGGQSLVLTSIVERCLSKQAAERFEDFKAVREELAEIYETLTGERAPEPVAGSELNAAQWDNKGISLTELERHEEALECYARVLAIDPRQMATWVHRGISLGALGRHEEALECYDRALKISPRYGWAWVNKGATLFDMERHEEAIVCYDHAIEIEPHGWIAWSNKSGSLCALGRSAEALVCANRALEIYPQYEQSWLHKGWALDMLKRHEEAIITYNRALEINPQYEKAWFNKGVTMGTLGRHEEAMTCYDRAFGINPRNESALLNKGNALCALGRFEEAGANYERAIQINPQLDLGWLNRGTALMELSRYQEALGCLDQALKINPHSHQAWMNQGVALNALGYNEEARASYDHSLKVNPRYAEAWYNKGLVLATDLHRYPEALACFEKAQRFGLTQAAQYISLLRQALERR